MQVFIAGGTGLIGRHLVERLCSEGHHCLVLTRNVERGRARLPDERVQLVEGDPTVPGAWTEHLRGTDAVVHLAGANIFARRWSSTYKEEIRRSRVESTKVLAEAITQQDNRPRVFVQGSAVGYYGPRGDEELTEESPPGDDFLAHVCVEWEGASRSLEEHGVRRVIVRTGVVLAREEGALPTMLRPIRLFVGGPVGKGDQWVSWIHIDDIVGIFRHALVRSAISGVFNGTAPNPVRNRELVRTIGRLLGRPTAFKAPWFALRLALGEVADMLCTGQRVLPKRTLESGYEFLYPTLEPALRHLLEISSAQS